MNFPNLWRRRKLHGWWRVILGCLILLGILVPEKTEAQSRWRPSFSFYEQYTDNVDLTNEETVGAWKTIFNPAVTYDLPSLRRTIRVNIDLKLDYRLRDDGYEDMLHWFALWGYLGHQYSPRTTYELSTGYDMTYTTEDVKLPYVETFSALTRGDIFYIKPSLSHNLTKNTKLKAGLSYKMTKYQEEDSPDGDEVGANLYLEQRVGSRIVLNTGATYTLKVIDNGTGYTEYEIPLGISLDLTYLQLKLNGAYLYRDYDEGFSQVEDGKEEKYSSEGNFLFGLGVELGGQVLKLRATMVELKYSTNYHDDLYGRPYQNQEVKLALYHAFRKFDFYTDYRYGVNQYVQSDDKNTYGGPNLSLKWRIRKKHSMDFTLSYTDYDYQPEDYNHHIWNGVVDYNYNIYDWLYVGLSYGHRSSTSNVDEGNYTENLYAVFARATW